MISPRSDDVVINSFISGSNNIDTLYAGFKCKFEQGLSVHIEQLDEKKYFARIGDYVFYFTSSRPIEFTLDKHSGQCPVSKHARSRER